MITSYRYNRVICSANHYMTCYFSRQSWGYPNHLICLCFSFHIHAVAVILISHRDLIVDSCNLQNIWVLHLEDVTVMQAKGGWRKEARELWAVVEVVCISMNILCLGSHLSGAVPFSRALPHMSPSVPLDKNVPENRTGSNCYHHCLQAEPGPPSHSWQVSGCPAGFWKLHNTGNILYILPSYFIPVAFLLMSTLTHKVQTSLTEEGRDFRDCSLYSTNVFAVLPFTRIEKEASTEAAEKLPTA